MEDFWKRAKTFAEEAAKKSQSLTTSSATSRIADLVSETAKKSKELAAEASKKADEIKSAALRQADQIKSFSDNISIPPQFSAIAAAATSSTVAPPVENLERFGITDDLRSFVQGLTSTTFKHFPVNSDESESEGSDVATSNVRKDLNEFQEKHATLVLTTVKEISRLRYELCPRAMKERHFWKIYFTLVNTHVAPFEKQYMEELREAAKKSEDAKVEQSDVSGGSGKAEVTGKIVSKSSNSSSTEQDLDTFLLGDLEDSDEAPDDGEGSFDDDFDKIESSVSAFYLDILWFGFLVFCCANNL
ncbi:BSD domain protein [Medicago truncatula]|uniref:BSD domain protein n=1 Tax=Medicago truncatula TaxID=3880 RepID=A0A072UEQ6_MEDTR|nr:BSD domain protein [Medicago truncatula]